MGEGNVGIREYLRRYLELCPDKPVSLEVIVTGPRVFRCFEDKFWDGYGNVRASEFLRFLKLAEAGQPLPGPPPTPRGEAARVEREDLEASLRFCQEFFHL